MSCVQAQLGEWTEILQKFLKNEDDQVAVAEDQQPEAGAFHLSQLSCRHICIWAIAKLVGKISGKC